MEKQLEKQQLAKEHHNNAVDSYNNNHTDRITAVRDLIFGENMQQYNAEFADVYAKIKSLQDQTNENLSKSIASLENKLSDLESLMEHKVQDLNDDLDKKIADLENEKADRKKLGKALEKIALMLQE